MCRLLCLVVFVLCVFMSGYALATDSCGAGYYINDAGECEICPGGYYCTGDGTKLGCPMGDWCIALDKGDEGLVWPIGAENRIECLPSIASGYYLQSSDAGYLVEQCMLGYWCPGVALAELVDGLGISHDGLVCNGSYEFGLRSCFNGYIDVVGSDGADDCKPCPKLPEDLFGGRVVLPVLGARSREQCGATIVFGVSSFEVLVDYVFSIFGMGDFDDSMINEIIVWQLVWPEFGTVLGECFLNGRHLADVYMDNSAYNPNLLSNKSGPHVIQFVYNAALDRYDAMDMLPALCNAGYYIPEYLYEVEYGTIVNSVSEIERNSCQPVGSQYWSPGWSADMATGNLDYGFERYVCPEGMFTTGYGAGADAETDCCMTGMRSFDNSCAAVCASGVSYVKTATGVSVPLFAESVTSPALNVMYNDTVCFAGMAEGVSTDAINIEYNDVVYHLIQ